MMNIDGLKLAMLFASKPSELGYCGIPFNLEKIINLMNSKRWEDEDIETVKKWLTSFEAFFSYTVSIAEVTKLDPFDKKIVEAYVIGNELWDKKIEGNVAEKLKERIIKYVVSKNQIDALGKLSNIVKKVHIPLTHNFHVLYFGSITGKLEITVSNQDMCKISLGKVKEVLENSVVVEYNRLINDGEWKTLTAELEVQSPFFSVEKNDYVLIHWKTIFWKPTQRQVKNYRKYFERLLKSLNSLNL